MSKFKNLLQFPSPWPIKVRMLRSFKNSRLRESKRRSDTVSDVQKNSGGKDASLLSDNKSIVLVNNFGDFDKTCSFLEMDGAICFQSVLQAAKDRLELEESSACQQDNYVKRKSRRRSRGVKFRAKNDCDEDRDYKKLLQTLQDTYKENNLYENIPMPNTGRKFREIEGINELIRLEKRLHEIRLLRAEYLRLSRTTDFPINIEPELEFNFPENLFLYSCKGENSDQLTLPRKCLTGALSHYQIDGTSIVPALFLDVRHGERVLDVYSGSGDKALLILQTLYPQQVICTDPKLLHIAGIRKLLQEYIFDYEERWDGKRIILHDCDVRQIDTFHCFDKILLDVPSSPGNPAILYNLDGKGQKAKDPIYLPELQITTLENCIRLLRPGGTLIYATRSMTREQNDSVVHLALRNVFHKYKTTVTIKDLRYIVELFSDLYHFKDPSNLKYGQMVLPQNTCRYGPLYICKLTRDEV